ncbi:NUDIX hydrolase [Sinisalibacter lacisalsi]|uniref:NUDIX hydrolase n=1 Tax=Sinisalibacter lacisalsi TaxID=1526570 RepID=A0ABQ1QTD9_9RHOB|nr:NUDIX hydrolase [Sinisalibacter lacisalsi]GGD45143.1 NUDIX hydrolase [Sinisalibacter lacisalsi]
MSSIITKAWDEVLVPMFRRPSRFQVAALCYRKSEGRKEVLLITTRRTGRWMLPKGWPMDGKTAAEAARIEAWEEAGVKSAKVRRAPVGEFDYIKHHDDGLSEPCSATVYALKVTDMADEFPEAGQRERAWVTLDKAADMVEEESLSALLRAF